MNTFRSPSIRRPSALSTRVISMATVLSMRMMWRSSSRCARDHAALPAKATIASLGRHQTNSSGAAKATSTSTSRRPRMWQKKIALAFVVLSGLGSRPVYAGSISIIPRPDASYLAITNLIEISAPDFASVASITDGSQVITFSTPMEVRTVPTSWSTWGFPPNTESATPRVLWTEGIEAMTFDSGFTVGDRRF